MLLNYQINHKEYELKITILGAHNLESSDTRMASILIDDSLALDAGGLTGGLSLTQQGKIRAILLTHQHFDHIKDIASIGLKNAFHPSIEVYGSDIVLKILKENLINGVLYPDFTKWPSADKPSLKLHPIEPYKLFKALNYSVLPLPTNHVVPTTGFAVSDSEKTLFYTGDTGPGLKNCWEHISPDLIITEITGPSSMGEDFFNRTGHLSPTMLKQELSVFKKLKGYFPQVILMHINPEREGEVRSEIEAVAAEVGISITMSRENMQFTL